MKKIGLLLVFILGILIVPTFSFADVKNNDDIEIIKMSLRNEGVSDKQIDGLVEKFINGEEWDSFKEEYMYLEPQIKTDTYTKTIYPDGSFVIRKIEFPLKTSNKVLKSAGITTLSGVTTLSGIEASANYVVAGAEFKVDLKMDSSTRKARILSQYDIDAWTVGGSYSNLRNGYWTDWRTPTNAWLSFDYKTPVYSKFVWLKLYADGDDYWQENS